MKRVVGPAGYTILETMIFLAVSAALFFSASVLITGRQRKTQFATTVRDFSSKLESVYGNVASGYYNTSGDTLCVIDASTKEVTVSSGGAANSQGTNGDCVYLGQVVVSPGTGSSDFHIISLVGRRTTTDTPPKEVQHLWQADPTLYMQTMETYTLAGAEFLSVTKDDGTAAVGDSTTGSSLAFIGSFGSYKTVGNKDLLQTSASHTDVYPIPSSNTTPNSGEIESSLAAEPPAPVLASNPKNITYCLTNGEQNAKVTLTGGISSYVIGDKSLCL